MSKRLLSTGPEPEAAERRRQSPVRADVIVIGAGAAGVFAMRELTRLGLTVIGLEARHRIGGRILTRRRLSRHPVELGAEFVHGPDNLIHELAAEYGLTLVPHTGEAYSWWDGKLVPESRFPKPPLTVLHEIRRLADRQRKAGLGAMPLAEFLGTPDLVAILSGSDVTRRYIDQLVKNDHAVEPTSLTLEGWLEADVSGYESNFRVAEGYSTLLQRAAADSQLDIRLSRPVERIEWDPGNVTCFARDLTVRARAVIVTLPLGVLQQGDVEFDGPLPAAKIEAIDSLLPGKVLKMISSFRSIGDEEPFWPEDMAFVVSALDSQLHWPTLPSGVSSRRQLLTHLVGGDAADRFGQDADPPQAMLSQLVHMFRKPRIRKLFIRAEWRLWHADRYSRSGYSAFPSDADDDAREMLGQPVSETLFFAGEAVGVRGRPGMVASVHGAIESGMACAREVAAALRG